MDEHIERILELRRLSWSNEKIGLEVGLGTDTVRKIIQREAPALAGRAKMGDRNFAILGLAGKGKPPSAIARELGLRLSVVQSFLYRARVKTTPAEKAAARARLILEVIRLDAEGYANSEIALRLGISRGTVGGLLARARQRIAA